MGISGPKTQASNNAFDSTSISVAVPHGANALALNDLILVGLGLANTQTGPASSTGFTSFGTIGDGVTKYAFYKIADSTDVALSASSGSWTFTVTDGFVWAAGVMAFSGVNTTTPFAAGPSINSASTTSVTANGLTSPASGSYYVILFNISNNSGALTSDFVGPTLDVQAQFSGFDVQVRGYHEIVGSGATGNRTATISTGWEWGTTTMILSPAASGSLVDVDAGTDTPAVGDSLGRDATYARVLGGRQFVTF